MLKRNCNSKYIDPNINKLFWENVKNPFKSLPSGIWLKSIINSKFACYVRTTNNRIMVRVFKTDNIDEKNPLFKGSVNSWEDVCGILSLYTSERIKSDP